MRGKDFGIIGISLLAIAAFVGIWGTIAYVLAHFIGKFW